MFLFWESNFYPDLVVACALPKFSLKCIAATSNLEWRLMSMQRHPIIKLAYLQCIPIYEKPNSLGAK